MSTFSRLARIELAPPDYLSMPTAGVDVSASGIKVVTFKETTRGLELDQFAEERIAPGEERPGRRRRGLRRGVRRGLRRAGRGGLERENADKRCNDTSII